MSITVTPIDADFESACAGRYVDGKAVWASLKRDAAQAAAHRLLRANLDRQKAIVAELPRLTGAPWMELQDEFTRLLEELPQLERLAFPAAFTDQVPPRCDHKFVGSARCLKCGWAPEVSSG